MNLAPIKDPQVRDKYVSMIRKRILLPFRRKCRSRPIFVFGKQRSGTSMLMYAFHRHPDVLVYDEHRDNRAFRDHRLRDTATIRDILERARFSAVCFKPICDSHRIRNILADFPDAHCIWIYRDYRDVANSSLRKFEAPTRAIEAVCTGQQGGGWFQEGVSAEAQRILRHAYHDELSNFDLSCLVWWARNRIVVESGLLGSAHLTLVKYEALVCEPERVLRWMFDSTFLPYRESVARNIRASSIGRHPRPAADDGVRHLCGSLMYTLDKAFQHQCSTFDPKWCLNAGMSDS